MRPCAAPAARIVPRAPAAALRTRSPASAAPCRPPESWCPSSPATTSPARCPSCSHHPQSTSRKWPQPFAQGPHSISRALSPTQVLVPQQPYHQETNTWVHALGRLTASDRTTLCNMWAYGPCAGLRGLLVHVKELLSLEVKIEGSKGQCDHSSPQESSMAKGTFPVLLSLIHISEPTRPY
eukprot:TRINITY_DN52987_c0_g1_i2.p1 TRINITY_DN52987_c0_g1~~TRINITY_DN52987_c0_g1_i2.p1  ORF type:complete len:181 (+),score=4.09 TRINITY_DN52987_c0_g1_i2:410-952(+)